MKQPDPWAEIGRAGLDGSVSARRVDPQHPWDFFWARDGSGRPMLVLQHAPESSAGLKAPVLHGVEISEEQLSDHRSATVITLKRQDDREIFHHLCTDIVDAARSCPSERHAVREAVARTWKWHALLKMQGDGRLSSQAQQGLIGELLFLQRLLDFLEPAVALEFWRGPLDEPRDFVGNGSAVEVKARQAGLSSVLISSEQQLAECTGELALVVFEISPANAETEGSFTLDQLVQRLHSRVQSLDPGSLSLLDGLLAAAGLFSEHRYDDRHWITGAVEAFSVHDGFPRIIPEQLPAGVAAVRYRLDLLACAGFQRPIDDAITILAGEYA